MCTTFLLYMWTLKFELKWTGLKGTDFSELQRYIIWRYIFICTELCLGKLQAVSPAVWQLCMFEYVKIQNKNSTINYSVYQQEKNQMLNFHLLWSSSNGISILIFGHLEQKISYSYTTHLIWNPPNFHQLYIECNHDTLKATVTHTVSIL